MITTKTEEDFVAELRNRLGVCQYASLKYKTKETINKAGEKTNGGELSRYTILLGTSYIHLLEKSLLELEIQFNENKFKTELELLAAETIKESLTTSLTEQKKGEQHPDYTKKDLYISIVPGLLINPNDSSFQLFGLVQSRTVLIPGIHKKVMSAPLTIAKNEIRKSLPINKFREFALDFDTVQQCKIAGDTIILGE